MMEMILVAIIALFVFEYNKRINTKKFFEDNIKSFNFLKEDDYDFLVKAKYGDSADPDILFHARLKSAFIVLTVMIAIFLYDFSFLNIILSIVVAYFIYKSAYSKLKAYYKKHLHEINLMLPYFLKNMEILAQHYTIPVALSKAIETAPDIFRPGLKEIITKINTGDSSVEPYMDFAKQYPVSDSIRMMRLLYRLGLGLQENKHEQLIMFSRNVSALQNKAREQKYKDRLKTMENKTMVMLGVTGGGVLVLLLLSIVSMMSL